MHASIHNHSHVHVTEDGDQPVVFTLQADLLKDTDLYQDGPAHCPALLSLQHATELWSACRCSSKGNGTRKRDAAYA